MGQAGGRSHALSRPQTTQRNAPARGRGRPTIRRRVSGECAGGRRATGSLIPHAGAIRPLMIPMIGATFRTPALSVTGGRDRSLAAGGAAERTATEPKS